MTSQSLYTIAMLSVGLLVGTLLGYIVGFRLAIRCNLDALLSVNRIVSEFNKSITTIIQCIAKQEKEVDISGATEEIAGIISDIIEQGTPKDDDDDDGLSGNSWKTIQS